MIIPVRCVTCGKVLASKWRKYQERVGADGSAGTEARDQPDPKADRTGLIGPRHGEVLDSMGISKMCCRRHMLTNVDAMDRI